MKFIYTILILVLSVNLYAQPWMIQNSNTTQGLNSVFFVNSNTGYIGGSWGTFLKTTNGGTNWVALDMSYIVISKIYFTSVNDGYYIREGSSSVSKTTNGGLNWTSYGSGNQTMYDLHFPSPSTGYACGSSNTLIRTTNAGLNWITLNSGLNSTYNISSVFFLSNEIGFVSASGASVPSQILFTTNTGNNWYGIYNGNFYVSEMDFVDFTTGYAVGAQPIYGAIMKTSSGGSNWTSLTIPIQEHVNSISAPSTDYAYAVANNGKIIGTSNGGSTWSIQASLVTPSDHFYSVFFINNSTGWAVGSSGIIRKTTNAGGLFVGLSTISNRSPVDYKLNQNYPNPFNPTTTIALDIRKISSAKLVVYDLSGREVRTLVDEELKPGSYQVEFNGANLSSGIYYYKLIANEYIETRKMVLVK